MMTTMHNTNGGDDWLDGALREGRDSYIDDNGFALRVMSALPAVAQPPAWRKPVVATLWGVALVGTGIAMPGLMHDAAREAYRIYTAQPVTLPMLATLAAGVGIAMWTAAAMTLRFR
jgi:hypothetical protein